MDTHATPIELIDAFGIGVYLLLGIFHFDLWRHRRERLSHLWLALASTGALAVDGTGMLLRHWAGAGTSFFVALNLTGVAVATASLVELVQSLVAGRTPRAIRLFQIVLLVIPAVAVIGELQALVFVILAGAGLLLAYASTVALRAGREGDPEARIVAAGLVVLIACLVTDVLMELRVMPKAGGLPILGFTVLFLASTRALNTRFQREHRELIELRLELEARVEERTRDLAELAARFAESSRTDQLTGLANRRGFLETVEREIERARRAGASSALVIADLDHFKAINDRFGHAGGDAVLRAFAGVLRNSARSTDVVARWGGEEFVLFLPDADVEGARQLAERIRVAVADRSVAHDAATISMTASFGVAPHDAARDLDATIADADRALYRAKDEGRNRVVVA